MLKDHKKRLTGLGWFISGSGERREPNFVVCGLFPAGCEQEFWNYCFAQLSFSSSVGDSDLVIIKKCILEGTS